MVACAVRHAVSHRRRYTTTRSASPARTSRRSRPHAGRTHTTKPTSTTNASRPAEAGSHEAVVVPIAFVSEHIETLVELDVDYAELALEKGASPYFRVPTAGVQTPFIETLADAAVAALGRTGVAPFGPGCKADWKACPHRNGKHAA